MFKKLANLFFEEVEEEEIYEEKPKVEKKIVKEPEVEKKVEKKEEPIQKTFEKKKEKSIFIDNTNTVNKPKPRVKVEAKEVEEIDYEFTPIISPIRGLKETDKNTYQINRSQKKTVPITVSRLGTIISPIFGLGKGKNKETFEKLSQMQKDADASGEVLEINQEIIDRTLHPDFNKEELQEPVEKAKTPIEVEEVIKESVKEAKAAVKESPQAEFTYLTLDDLVENSYNKPKEENEKDRPHFFIGIKGTGMSALASLLNNAGYKVLGSDTEDFVFTETDLKTNGIETLPFNKNNIKDDMVVIIGNSFYDDHSEVIAAKNNDTIKTYTYHEYLGKFIEGYNSIAVSGSHGKTTTTSMIVDMLSLSMPTGYLIGDGRGAIDKNAEVIVIEACEYKRHFLSYKADYGVITNLEWDHVDYYKTNDDYLLAFEQFSNQIKNTVLVYGDDKDVDKLNINTKVLYYGESDKNDIQAININESSEGTNFEVLYLNENIGKFEISLIGRHMMHNALATIGIGKLKGLSNQEIKAGLDNYQGARRRFEVSEIGDSVVIDDYAHHPTEVDVTIKAAKTKYPNHKLVAVYHPDRIARLNTFADDYIKALKQANVVAIGKAVDSDGMSKVIDLSVLLNNLDGSFVVDDDQTSISKLARQSPAVYLFMGTKEMHSIKKQLIDYLKRIDI